MKVKATEHVIVDNGNAQVINRKESLLANDFILNGKELDNQQVNKERNHNKTGPNICKTKMEILSRVLFINGDNFH